jgi:hypothetical protein
MTKIVRVLAISGLLFAAASAAQAQGISFGIHIGEPPPERAYRVPPQPGPDYVWIEGYQYPQGSHYAWHNGYWTRPPYAGAYWVPPYYVRGQYYVGQWQGPRRSFAHDHRWDKSHQRDEHRDPYPNDHNNNNQR